MRTYTIEQAHQLAKENGGECLSDKIITPVRENKLSWRCSHGHEWQAQVHQVLGRGTWCPKCSGRNQTVEDLQELAQLREGKCLAREYLGSRIAHQWECYKGHRWQAAPDSIRSGHWCPKCADVEKGLRRRKNTLEKVHKIAESKGGRCLSTVDDYDRHMAKVKLECQFGHQWSCLPGNITSAKSWCPSCHVQRKKHTIEKMQEFAKKRGGECLSTEYVATHKPLLWRCREGHEFSAPAGAVLNNARWCSQCKHQEISLNDAINMAREKGGNCLSSRAKNSSSLLTWECSQGHQWRTNYLNAKERWCGECAANMAKLMFNQAA